MEYYAVFICPIKQDAADMWPIPFDSCQMECRICIQETEYFTFVHFQILRGTSLGSIIMDMRNGGKAAG
jgi:hypothetical protein